MTARIADLLLLGNSHTCSYTMIEVQKIVQERKDGISTDIDQKAGTCRVNQSLGNDSLRTSISSFLHRQPASQNISENKTICDPQQSGDGSTTYLERSSLFP